MYYGRNALRSWPRRNKIMGWNQGYTIFEATVVGAYDLGKLDKKLLAVLMEPYRDSDIDSGGSRDLKSKDGMEVREIVLKIMRSKCPKRPDVPKKQSKWTIQDEMAVEAYHDKLYYAFNEITKFGW